MNTGCPDGEAPYGGLALGTDGYLYGTTSRGDLTTSSGTIFKINPNGQGFDTLYQFCSPNCSDGELPYSGLLQGTNGDFYGTNV